MYKSLIFSLLIFFSIELNASEGNSEKLPNHDWSFEGVTGTFDRSALQRGFKVHREVCSSCHSLNLIYYRDLINLGFSEEQVKVIAADYIVLDGPNDEGEMFERPAKPSDKFFKPYANDNEARFNNNGSYPPDLSLITKSRKNGFDYLYNLLLGYSEQPSEMELGEGMYYNKWMPGNQIAMPQPLYDDSVEYDDGTDPTTEQLAEDIVSFLAWVAEPEMEERKRLGIKVIIFFIILGLIMFFLKRRLWRNVN